MKKVNLAVAIAAAVVTVVLAGCSKGFESSKKVDDLTITLSTAKYPLVKSDNILDVKVTDSSGKAVTDATVNVRYYMLPMPGMAPRDFNIQAAAKGSMYAATANIPVEGGWNVEVTVTRPVRPAVMATFNLDAR